jgi:lipopolysaccharide export system permease protein
MKKLDILVLRAWVGPFVLTLAVVVFILLVQTMLKYFEEFVGKNLGIEVFAELLFYFALNLIPIALPLAVLFSTLLAFGNLGENNELTAIKTSGITLARVIAPVAVVVVFLTAGSIAFNDQIVPLANLRAYSLLYDIRQKKPALDLKPGIFYHGLPGYAVKANRKGQDGRSLGQIMIYDHSASRGNINLITADTGQMYTQFGDRYLVLDLKNGRSYTELVENDPSGEQFVRNTFGHSRFIFSLASFDLNRTKVELFSQNRMMRNLAELRTDIDSIKKELVLIGSSVHLNTRSYFFYLYRPKSQIFVPPITAGSIAPKVEPMSDSVQRAALALALVQVRNIRSFTTGYKARYENIIHDINIFSVARVEKFTQGLAVFVLFLIGAPLGAIIRKGGLGLPVLISIVFFVLYYVLSLSGTKWAKEGVADINLSMWYANAVLILVGLFFLNQARRDAALLDFDFYRRLLGFKRKSAALAKP